jgi:hypothetical protein
MDDLARDVVDAVLIAGAVTARLHLPWKTPGRKALVSSVVARGNTSVSMV